MKTYTDLENRQEVYLTCKAIFSGPESLLRVERKIISVIERNEVALHRIHTRLGKPKVLGIIKQLLKDGIFKSDSLAKAEFPSLFHATPQRTAQRAASEAHAAKVTKKALKDLTIPIKVQEQKNDTTTPPASPIKTDDPVEITNNAHEVVLDNGPPSLYPIYITYMAQHQILTKVQQVLENCCFEFAQRWFPEHLQEHDWDCAEAVELTKWTSIIDKRSAKLPSHAFACEGKTFEDIFLPVHGTRHTAVHRPRTTAECIAELLNSATAMAKYLNDETRALQLNELATDFNERFCAMNLSKNALESDLTSKLKEIDLQRQQLKKQEKELMMDMLREDRNNQILVSTLLESSLDRIFTNQVKPHEDKGNEVMEKPDQEDESMIVNSTSYTGSTWLSRALAIQ